MNPTTPNSHVNTRKYIVAVDSVDRDRAAYPKPNDYTISLPQTYKDIVRVRLLSLELPTTYYLNRADLGNTTIRFGVAVKNPAVGVTTSNYVTGEMTSDLTAWALRDIVMEDGNYNTVIFPPNLEAGVNASNVFNEAALQEAYDETFPELPYTIPPRTTNAQFDVFINSATLRMGIKSITGDMFRIYTSQMSTNPIYWGLGYYMGFEKNMVYECDPANLTITAPKLVNFNPVNTIFLELDGLNNIDECGIGGMVSGKRCFAKVASYTNSFDPLFRNEDCCIFNENELRPPLSRLARLHILWRYHDGTVVDFNDIDHSFTLQIDCVESQFTQTSSIPTINDLRIR